jgi:hypothetical protein
MKTLLTTALLLILFGSCSTRKTITSHEIKTSNKLEVINQPINDKLFISIPEVRTINTDCDSLAQDAVDKVCFVD